MKQWYEKFFEELLIVEGGYVNNPDDSGGRTRYGITEAVARANGYKDDMRELPLPFAKKVYKRKYWDVLNIDVIAEMDQDIAYKLADIAVNMGPKRAAEFLQRLLNALNRGEKDYQDITVDCEVGPRTISALRAYMAYRKKDGALVLCRGLNCLQGAFYVNLAEKRRKDEAFLYGWLLNRIS